MAREIEVGTTPISIGRSRNNDIVVDEPAVSRRHAVLHRTNEGLELQDRSSNGSFVNDRRVDHAILDLGDAIQVGSLRMIVTREGVLLPDSAIDPVPNVRERKQSYALPIGLLGAALVLLFFALRGHDEDVSTADEVPATSDHAAVAGATDTAVPGAEPTSEPSDSTPIASQPPASVLSVLPSPGSEQNGVVQFVWATSYQLQPNEVFDVRVCAHDGCMPSEGKVNLRVTEWKWCPDEGAGSYRWQVVVVDSESKQSSGTEGPIAGFEWSGGCTPTGEGEEQEEDPTNPTDGDEGDDDSDDPPSGGTDEPGKGPVTPVLP